jgi:hypothetical protein
MVPLRTRRYFDRRLIILMTRQTPNANKISGLRMDIGRLYLTRLQGPRRQATGARLAAAEAIPDGDRGLGRGQRFAREVMETEGAANLQYFSESRRNSDDRRQIVPMARVSAHSRRENRHEGLAAGWSTRLVGSVSAIAEADAGKGRIGWPAAKW